MLSLLIEAFPTLLLLFGKLLKASDASEATLEAYDKLVQASKDEGLISIDTKNVFVSQKAKIDAAIAADEKALADAAKLKTGNA